MVSCPAAGRAVAVFLFTISLSLSIPLFLHKQFAMATIEFSLDKAEISSNKQTKRKEKVKLLV